ncbi:unnamed protein product [Caretta caretta]
MVNLRKSNAVQYWTPMTSDPDSVTLADATKADRQEQLDRWTEHYKELYSKDVIICDTALAAIPHLPTMQELDQTPTLEDVEKAIKEIASGTAADNYPIPLQLLKAEGRKLASDN